MRWYALGDSMMVVQLGDEIGPQVHRMVRALDKWLNERPFSGFIESIPAFTTVSIVYNPLVISYQDLEAYLEDHIPVDLDSEDEVGRTVEVPVCYGGEYGPDLQDVADYHGITVEDVIDIHSNTLYTVYMIGFAPGFPYLGGMSEKLATPRLATPRINIPAGSVGIGGTQTGIYPIASPGGWRLIGRTPLQLFQPEANPPSRLRAGDLVKFVPISVDEYKAYEELNHASQSALGLELKDGQGSLETRTDEHR
jgi:inhibitor of KinA